MLVSTEEKLRAALRLARDMLVVNEINLPHTMAKIDEALALPSSKDDPLPVIDESLLDNPSATTIAK